MSRAPLIDRSSNPDRKNKLRGSFKLTHRMEEIGGQVRDFVKSLCIERVMKNIDGGWRSQGGGKKFCVEEGVGVIRDGGSRRERPGDLNPECYLCETDRWVRAYRCPFCGFPYSLLSSPSRIRGGI